MTCNVGGHLGEFQKTNDIHDSRNQRKYGGDLQIVFESPAFSLMPKHVISEFGV